MRSRVRAPSHLIEMIDEAVRLAAEAGVIMQRAEDAPYLGRFVAMAGEELLNFGGCSYLGLELRSELIEGTIAAVRKFGTQLSFSRAYLQSPLYEQLEAALERMTDGYVVATPTTSLAHIAALPVLIGERDAVVIDRATHASVHTALLLLKGVSVTCVDHNDLAQLERTIAELSASHSAVWYVLDGLYSMHGDFAPFARIAELLARYPALHLYVDDAHSTSWTGRAGRGRALEVLPDRSRVVVALSLNKAFAAAGGALVFADPELRDRVRRIGGPMLFSGPIQPPMLGAALASAELHVRDDFADLQRELLARIELTNALAARHGIALAARESTPIFFAYVRGAEAVFELVRWMRQQGFFVCPSTFPAVSHSQSGVRFTISLHNRAADIERLMSTLAQGIERVGGAAQGAGQAERRVG